MAAYTKDEFYGDLLDYNMDKAGKRIRNAVFYILVPVFLAVFISLWVWPDQTNSFLNSFDTSRETDSQTMNPYQWLALVGLVLILLPFVPTVIHVLRKYWLYPKSSLILQAFLPVKSKELIIHPRTRNSNGNPKSYFIIVQHPYSAKLIPVDTEEEWFGQLKEGDQVHVFYHPAQGNILYLKKR